MAGVIYKSIDGYSSSGELAFDSITVNIITVKELKLADARQNIRIDDSSGRNLTLSAFRNTLVGKFAAETALTPSDSVVIGAQAGRFLSTGTRNVLIGAESGLNLAGGTDHLICGYRAGQQVASGDGSVLLGNFASVDAKSSQENVVIGYQGARKVEGKRNVAIGSGVAPEWLSGESSVVLGAGSAVEMKSGDLNFIFGACVGFQQGSRNIFLNPITPLPASVSDRLQIGDLIEGDLKNETLSLHVTTLTVDGQVDVSGQETMLRRTLAGPSQSIPNSGIPQVLTVWNQEDLKKGNPSYLGGIVTVSSAGVYSVTYAVTFDGDPVGFRTSVLVVNGTTPYQRKKLAAWADSSPVDLDGSCVVHLGVGGTVQIQVSQDSSSGPINCVGVHFSVTKMH